MKKQYPEPPASHTMRNTHLPEDSAPVAPSPMSSLRGQEWVAVGPPDRTEWRA